MGVAMNTELLPCPKFSSPLTMVSEDGIGESEDELNLGRNTPLAKSKSLKYKILNFHISIQQRREDNSIAGIISTNLNQLPPSTRSPFYSDSVLATNFLDYSPGKLDPFIENYFLSDPSQRKELRKDARKIVNSAPKVLEVLEWSTDTKVRDAYEAAVDLLARCDDVLLFLEVALYLRSKQLPSKNCATFISGLARAQHILLHYRLGIIDQHRKSEQRVIKESVVEALFLLASEVQEKSEGNSNIGNILIQYLHWFASDKQSDPFIQRYAEDCLSELL